MKRGSIRTYGRHRNRVIVSDAWLTESSGKESVFGTSSENDSSKHSSVFHISSSSSENNSDLPDPSFVEEHKRITRQRNITKDTSKDEKENKQKATNTSRQTRLTQKKSTLNSTYKSENNTSKLLDVPPRALRNRSPNIIYNDSANFQKQLCGATTKRKRLVKSKILAAKELSVNFSDFDDYSLTIQDASTDRKKEVGVCMETSTPVAKRTRKIIPIKNADISHIEMVLSPSSDTYYSSTETPYSVHYKSKDVDNSGDITSPSSYGESSNIQKNSRETVEKPDDNRTPESVVLLTRLTDSFIDKHISGGDKKVSRHSKTDLDGSDCLFSTPDPSINDMNGSDSLFSTPGNAIQENIKLLTTKLKQISFIYHSDEEDYVDEHTEEVESEEIDEDEEEEVSGELEEDSDEGELSALIETEEGYSDSFEKEPTSEGDEIKVSTCGRVTRQTRNTRNIANTVNEDEDDAEEEQSDDDEEEQSDDDVDDNEEQSEDDDDDESIDANDEEDEEEEGKENEFEIKALENKSIEEKHIQSARSRRHSFRNASLKNSFSEMLTPTKVKGSMVPVPANTKVMVLCGQTEPISFTEALTRPVLMKCLKIGEGVYGEVFRSCSNDQSVAIKVIPIEGDFPVNDEPQKKFDEILPEIVIAKELSDLRFSKTSVTSTYCEVNSVSCVRGKYPANLLKQWDDFHKAKRSENDRPDIFKSNQLFIVFEFADCGTALDNYKFDSLLQAKSILTQVAFALAVAEEALQFEHRDLHWGNVLVRRTDHEEMTFRLHGHKVDVPTMGVEASIIDYTMSRLTKDGCKVYSDLSKDDTLFQGKGDYQFDIYRKMKEANGNNWAKFCPYTNVLWLHYLADKLVYRNGTSLQSRDERDILRQFRQFLSKMLDYSSACEMAADALFLNS